MIDTGKFLAAVMAVALLSACAGTVVVPDPGEVEAPRPVFLLDHGRHTSLVLTRADESMIRYLYGDWRWYALQDTGLCRAFPTLFAETQATLGRRELRGPPEESSIRRQVPVTIRRVHEMPAPADRIDSLAFRLDKRFRAAIETLHYNADYDLEFVHDPKPYTLGDNSNHVVANWLRQLDFEVTGNPIFGCWRLTTPDHD